MLNLRELYEGFWTVEQQWFQQHQPQSSLAVLEQQSNSIAPGTNTAVVENTSAQEPMTEDCSFHYGEWAFLLAGLKPCLLIQLRTPDQTVLFFREVLAPFFRQHEVTLHQLQIDYSLITRPVRSPEMDLRGFILVWNKDMVSRHPQRDRLLRGIDMLCGSHSSYSLPSAPNESAARVIADRTALISEEDLAMMLDLPGRLPETESEIFKMVEVSYWHERPQDLETTQASVGNELGTGVQDHLTLLTAFAAQPDEIPNIRQHFTTYRDRVQELFGIRLRISVQSMA
ncbi:hypothetical protein BGW38_005276 [Lunasporangiospora selenospora]|uniref:Uncharacterized protein n=1 Tax=Lunasporangiospora selenospora TaxID=979761 RepID=A0A9P6FNN2_9FUNG|nr:hypothetical protein BGW38_005276 [Lunasporangiospora selenospora]